MSAPELLVVVDTEEEFDWNAPFSRDATTTRSIPAQARAHEIYDRFGVVPTYVVDYPVATDPAAVAFLKRLADAGKAEIGAHLHPWVTPPHIEEVNERNSFHCNLPPELERAKIETITAAIETAFGARPKMFKAGRYGFGANTQRVLVDLGYQIDCSITPHTSFRDKSGPDFRHAPDAPHWLDEAAGLLEVPLTIGHLGALARFGGRFDRLFDDRRAARLHVPGALSRAGLVARSRLTPEGTSADEQCRLIAAMHARGHRTFSLTYHSPSLEPGHTSYVRDAADLARFLADIETVLTFFRDAMGGRFTTLTRVREDWAARRAAA
ncbi:polysaccharide deacetylase family protein [Sphingosinicella sp. LHD-64]|uniref:polysaccharide deacetylase family protein n=1 Tax=Sphingosinicella sp. LHD-64 TaxID=3072139 RepID=UPI00281047D0|nr:polysaccharide deacetylase family protein [Sphingosinicella sp. LHD-64]MDQ8754611.1 polysaccharide deacetylase family protein [Sphingosinicella sp. LHD-64]